MPKAKAGVLDGSRCLDIRALLGGNMSSVPLRLWESGLLGDPKARQSACAAPKPAPPQPQLQTISQKKGIRQVMRGIRILWIRALWIRILWKQREGEESTCGKGQAMV
jgi:hypothetical protein